MEQFKRECVCLCEWVREGSSLKQIGLVNSSICIYNVIIGCAHKWGFFCRYCCMHFGWITKAYVSYDSMFVRITCSLDNLHVLNETGFYTTHNIYSNLDVMKPCYIAKLNFYIALLLNKIIGNNLLNVQCYLSLYKIIRNSLWNTYEGWTLYVLITTTHFNYNLYLCIYGIV